MSATNWDTCPQCKCQRAAERERKLADLKAAYGRITEDDYLARKAEAEQQEPVEETLREDYEIGMDGKGFYVVYRCYCGECGLEHNFSSDEPLDYVAAPA